VYPCMAAHRRRFDGRVSPDMNINMY
jgi:hypothetical protein